MTIDIHATAQICSWAVSLALATSARADDLQLNVESVPPPLMPADVYDESETDLQDYWVSEKYDGIRAYWSGSRLLTRAGNVIHAPDWFIAGLPTQALDGELWIGRRQFEALLATVRDEVPDDVAWHRVRFMVFDLPAHGGRFSERRLALGELISSLKQSWVHAVEHWRASDQHVLRTQLDEIVRAGGEGLMLHRQNALYHTQRSDDLLKVKQHEDAEAIVVGHVPGKGKHEGMVGALEVQRADGLKFRIGTGFSDEERRHPPSVGTWITYRYHGTTQNGIPKFATFVRVREEL